MNRSLLFLSVFILYSLLFCAEYCFSYEDAFSSETYNNRSDEFLVEETENNEAGNEDIGKLILHHILDSHEIELPFLQLHLPFLIVDATGLQFFKTEDEIRISDEYEVDHGKIHRIDGRFILDISPTKHVVFMWVVVLLLVIVLSLASKGRTASSPKGLTNLIEVFVVFIRDDISIPSMGKKLGTKMTPFLLTVFFFILFCNLIGLIPYGSTATGNVSVTGGLALISFVMIQVLSIKENGMGQYLKHLTGGVHWGLWIIMVPVEFMALLTKPFALCIRLFANMTAGHVAILALFAVIFILKSYIVILPVIAFLIFISILEIFVGFLQAYIFTMLTSLFIGLALPSSH